MAKDLLGALRIRVKRGIDLAIRDICSSDPYVVLKIGKQKVKTRVIKSNCNPDWNEELTLSISDPETPIKLYVFDYVGFRSSIIVDYNENPFGVDITISDMLLIDGIAGQILNYIEEPFGIRISYIWDRFSKDDPMGEAEIDIKPYMESLRMGLGELPLGTAVKKLQPNRNNCLAEESKVVWVGKGKMVQDMILRLKNVERGEVEIQIEWLELGGTRGVSSRRLGC